MWRVSRLFSSGGCQRWLSTTSFTRCPYTEIVQSQEDTVDLTAVVEKWKGKLPEASMDDINQILGVTVNNVSPALDDFLPSVVEELAKKLEKSDNEQFAVAFALLSRRPIKWHYPDLVKIFDQECFHRMTATTMSMEAVGLLTEALHACRHRVDKPAIFSQVLLATKDWEGPEYAVLQYLAYCDGMKDTRIARLAEMFLKTVDPSKLSPRAIVCIAQAFLYCERLTEYVPPVFFADMGLRIKLIANKFDSESISTLILFCIQYKCFFDGSDVKLVEQIKITPLWPLSSLSRVVYALSHFQQAYEERNYTVLNNHRRVLGLHEVAGQFDEIVTLFISLAHIGVNVPKWSKTVCRYLASSADLVAKNNARGTLRLLSALSELHALDDSVLEPFFRIIPLGGLDFGNLIQFCSSCAGQQGLIPDKFWEGMIKHCSEEVVAALPEMSCCSLFWLNELAGHQHLTVLAEEVEDMLASLVKKRLETVPPLVREFQRDIVSMIGDQMVQRNVPIGGWLKVPFAVLVDENGVPSDWNAVGAEIEVDPERLAMSGMYPVVLRFSTPEEYIMVHYNSGKATAHPNEQSSQEDGNEENGQQDTQDDGEPARGFSIRRQLDVELRCYEAAGWVTAPIQTGQWWAAEDKGAFLHDTLRDAVQEELRVRREREEELEE